MTVEEGEDKDSLTLNAITGALAAIIALREMQILDHESDLYRNKSAEFIDAIEIAVDRVKKLAKLISNDKP